MFGVGKIADEVHAARMEVATATAEAESAREMLHNQTALFTVQAEASARRVTEVMEGRVQQLAVHTDAQMSCITKEVTQ